MKNETGPIGESATKGRFLPGASGERPTTAGKRRLPKYRFTSGPLIL
ncbi:MAG: hypothetical protein KAX66_09785 [Propionivibrio sp.]|nr:hypothetical protein [Propionivibrio sp.]